MVLWCALAFAVSWVVGKALVIWASDRFWS